MSALPPIEIVTALVEDADGRVLMVRKRGTARFIKPGGKREPGESDLATLRREIEEELGVGFEPGAFVGRFEAPAANEPGRTVRAHVHRGRLTGAPQARAEIEEVVWLTPAEALDRDLAPLMRDLLGRIYGV